MIVKVGPHHSCTFRICIFRICIFCSTLPFYMCTEIQARAFCIFYLTVSRLVCSTCLPCSLHIVTWCFMYIDSEPSASYMYYLCPLLAGHHPALFTVYFYKHALFLYMRMRVKHVYFCFCHFPLQVFRCKKHSLIVFVHAAFLLHVLPSHVL